MGKSKGLFFISSAAFVISSLSVLMMILEISDILPGIVFWAGMIAGIVFYILSVKYMPVKKGKGGLPGGLHFFSNRPALVTDIVMIICLGLTIYFAVNFRSNQTIAAVILFLLILSVYAHFLFNGKVYKYIFRKNEKEGGKNYDQVKKTAER